MCIRDRSGAIINIILDPVFIFGFHWGMSGAALATVIGQVVSFVISVIYFFRTKTFRLSAQNVIHSDHRTRSDPDF